MATTSPAPPAGLHVERRDPEPGEPAASSRPVVLVHGAMDRAASFGRVARRLRDVALVRYDRRGYARSAELVPGSLDEQVEDLLAVAAANDGGQGTVVVGHSLGGVIAVAAAARRPDLIRSVAAFEAPMPWASWWPSDSAGGAAIASAGGMATRSTAAADRERPRADVAGDAAERFMRRMIGASRWERLPAGIRAQRRAEGSALLADLRSIRGATPAYDVAALVVPVLAGYGDASSERHRRAATELARAAADGELWVIEGASHGAHLSHPQAFADFVRRALERAGA
ncbi:MAG: alpha/beta hydrolase fold protein [Acidimicrobiales bacterium]|nr:alpha/beta hydrolase fold protein [Acidimicrobiales bacterium]